jgi:1,4-alpha-glucan branching enzyme
MITRKRTRGTETVSVTFTVDDAGHAGPVSVVGDFNGWDPTADPLRPRGSGGPPRATVRLQAGHVYRFRYVTDAGRWFDDETADGWEPNQYGDLDCLLDLVNSIG